ncbi:MAG: 1-acyl-sn-glycerol-3-phosphate acyltransferase [Chlamydiales bacterium]|nr:1-acyl-sn-glycerol-3-phosphate acyltransferase [Chlamydiales bacterium]
MDKKSIPEQLFLDRLAELHKQGTVPDKYHKIILQFYHCLKTAIEQVDHPIESIIPTFLLFLELVREQIEHPHNFEAYHQKIRHPIDYYEFSLDFIRPLINFPQSTIQGKEQLDKIEAQIANKENVIFLANHQTESDPQAIAILLEKEHPRLAESIIYVAGERVVTDPIAIPFSMGCDLLCVYSKRYIDDPPEEKLEKQLHNKNTMELMSRLLQEGGKAIYVAPSGGRDRKNAQGVIEVAPFDPQSIEMFYLMAKKSKTPTHFYPLSLSTYNLLPPPETIQKELGETRSAKYSPIHLFFAPEFDMEHFSGLQEKDKMKRREIRAYAIWNLVRQNYSLLKHLGI